MLPDDLDEPPRPSPVQEYPRMLYSSDGRQRIVATALEREQAELEGEWFETPQREG